MVWIIKIAFSASRDGVRSKMRRLAVLQSAPVDNKRQLVIVRRDGIEHLLMIGGPNDVVIETGFNNPNEVEQAAPTVKTEPPKNESVHAKIDSQQGLKSAPPIMAKPRAGGPSRTTPVSPLDDRVEPSLGETPSARDSNVTQMPNMAPIEKLQELARSKPDSEHKTLKYPGLLRGGSKQKGVDSLVSGNKNQKHADDSVNLDAASAHQSEPEGADTASKHEKDNAKQD